MSSFLDEYNSDNVFSYLVFRAKFRELLSGRYLGSEGESAEQIERKQREVELHRAHTTNTKYVHSRGVTFFFLVAVHVVGVYITGYLLNGSGSFSLKEGVIIRPGECSPTLHAFRQKGHASSWGPYRSYRRVMRYVRNNTISTREITLQVVFVEPHVQRSGRPLADVDRRSAQGGHGMRGPDYHTWPTVREVHFHEDGVRLPR